MLSKPSSAAVNFGALLKGSNLRRHFMAIEGKDYEDLKQAVVRLEFPSFISKITGYIEKPVVKIIDSLPVQASQNIQDAVKITLENLLALTVKTMDKELKYASSTTAYKIASGIRFFCICNNKS